MRPHNHTVHDCAFQLHACREWSLQAVFLFEADNLMMRRAPHDSMTSIRCVNYHDLTLVIGTSTSSRYDSMFNDQIMQSVMRYKISK